MRYQRTLCIVLLLFIPHIASAGFTETVDSLRMWCQARVHAGTPPSSPSRPPILKPRIQSVKIFCRARVAEVGELASRLSPFKALAPVFMVYAAERSSSVHVEASQRSLDQQFLDEISTGLEEREKGLGPLLDTYVPSQGLTIVIGRVSAGKSSITSYASGDELVAVRRNGTLVIDRKPGFVPKDAQQNPIVHGYTSGTRVPYRRGPWLDFPGLFGTEGPAGKILNAYSITRVLESAPRVRFLIAVTDSEIDARKGRGEHFVQIIKQICATLSESPMDQLKTGVNLVITQGNILDPDKYKNDIKEILRARSDEFSERERELLESMASPENKQITFFPEPPTEGPLSKGIKVIRDEARYVEGLKASPVLDDRTERHVKEVAKRITSRVTSQLEELYRGLAGHTKELVRSHGGDAQMIRGLFTKQRDALRGIRPGDAAFEANVQAISGVLQQLAPELSKIFMHLIKQRKILLSIKPDFGISLTFNKEGVLTPTLAVLTSLSTPPEPRFNNTSLAMDGYIIGVSDVVRALSGRDGISRIDVSSGLSFLIDSSLVRAGSTVTAVAPQWVIRVQQEISLRGCNGDSHQILKALPDQDGLPGRPGFNGGHFYGIADEVHGGVGLTIDVSGGNGGPGQAGGDGANGIDGKAGKKEDVEERKDSAKVGDKETLSRGFLRWFVTSNDAALITYRSGEHATSGHDAGAGGKGGYGGRSGSVKIVRVDNGRFFDFPIGARFLLDDGAPGVNGSTGTPGQGGQNRPVYEGVHIKKKRSMTELAKRAIVDGVAGAGTGAGTGAAIGTLGGPFGAAAGAIGGAIVGGISGVATPIIGSEVDKNNWRWEVEPHQVDLPGRAADGKSAGVVNDTGIKNPDPIMPINFVDIQKGWTSLQPRWQALFNSSIN